MSDIKVKPIKRTGQIELRVIQPLPKTKEAHLTFEMGPTGNLYDMHLTANLKGGKKLSTKEW